VTRVIYFSRDYTTHDYRFLSALAKTDYEVFFLRLERRKVQIEDRSLPGEIKQIPWAGGTKQVTLFDGPRLVKDIRGVIKKLKPDLIHAGPIQRSAFLVALIGFKPLVSMSWGYDLLMDADRSGFWRWATQYTLHRSAILVADCDTVRKKAVEFGMSGDRIVTFPWGVDLKAFIPGKNPPANGEQFTLLSTRSWEPIYGVDILARAFVKAAQKTPQIRLIMLGNGSQGGYLRNLFSDAGLMDRVILPGQVSQADLPRYYLMADVYVSASHVDGSSVSLMEALACGRPAVVSDIPGNREWVEHGENGWWFKDGDVDDLAQSILTAVNQSKQLVDMGKAARQVAEARADWDRNFPNLLNAYSRALGEA
jgi:glycosyltransferase involved in cell wall biosynthesis